MKKAHRKNRIRNIEMWAIYDLKIFVDKLSIVSIIQLSIKTTPMVSTLGAGLLMQPLLFLSLPLMRTIVYIDGFNFYYGAVVKTPYKWLDFKLLLQNLLSANNKILKIKYFTALVTGKIDPNAPVRQKTYLRALLKYIPELSIYYGTFNSHDVIKPLACRNKKYKKPFFVPIIKTEEKGSDVNLAVHLLNDAWLDEYDCAVVVSNDSDLAESLRIVKDQLNKKIGIINPRNKTPARKLMRHATFNKKIRKGVLKISQLPDIIPGTTIKKPKDWSKF